MLNTVGNFQSYQKLSFTDDIRTPIKRGDVDSSSKPTCKGKREQFTNVQDKLQELTLELKKLKKFI